MPAGSLGLVALLALWSVAAARSGRPAAMVPAPWTVLGQIARDGWAFYGPNILPTLGEAARGFLWGNSLAAALAVLLVPALHRVVVHLATVGVLHHAGRIAARPARRTRPASTWCARSAAAAGNASGTCSS